MQVEETMKAAKAVAESARQCGVLDENQRIWKAVDALSNKVMGEEHTDHNIGKLEAYLEVKKLLNEVKP